MIKEYERFDLGAKNFIDHVERKTERRGKGIQQKRKYFSYSERQHALKR
jgi:hypothetical protein